MEPDEIPPDQHNVRQRRKQLSAGMEHIRNAVTIPESPSPSSQDDSDAYGVPAYFQPVRKARTDTSNNPEKRSDPFQFGSRYLEEGDDIFDYNAWDHVETDEAYKQFAEEQYAKQRLDPASDFDKKRFNDKPEHFWNRFYTNNNTNFFKNRKWLQQEFPILAEVTKPDSPPTTILEVGAGAGNTAFPIMQQNQNPGVKMIACDFSSKAVTLIKDNPLYTAEDIVGKIEANVWDVASPQDQETGKSQLPEGIQPGTIDVVILIFIFSALAPEQWDQAVKNVWTALKPGGVVLFRDYGRGDLAQVRFKKGRYLDENFYVRGDGTRVYFFDEDELRTLWQGTPDAKSIHQTDSEAPEAKPSTLDEVELRPRFEIVNFGVDRRMLVNRQRRLKMYRCWMQGLFRKPLG